MTNTGIDDWTNQIHAGNCFDVLDELPENSVHAVVADGPYGLAFMGETWDDFEPLEYQRWTMQWAKQAKRALKPGGHMLSFSGTRTYHRMASGVEDAGFDIRDSIAWLYGTGFPKGQDISQALDEDNAESWEGFKTVLKPAHEPIVVARKPRSGSTVAENVLQHGTGALNIDECRIPTEEDTERPGGQFATDIYEGGDSPCETTGGHSGGRYPSNIVLNEQAASMLNRQSGVVGGASRFFYCAKASEAERTLNGRIDNPHSTVKPVDLMTWLVTLVTAEGQIVLDPFAGSGTTCKAAKESGRQFIGIEKDPEYADIARARCGLKPADPERLAGDGQSALQSFVQAEQESGS